MAKVVDSSVKFSGTIGDLTYVNRNGKIHVRRKRGTVKTKATINEKLQSFADRNSAVNRTAKPVNTILGEYAGKIREGGFWRKLLSCLKKCADDDPQTHMNSLERLELSEEHQFIIHVGIPPYTVTSYKDHFTVNIEFQYHASFREKEKNSCYYDLITILWDKNGEINHHDSITTRWFYRSETLPVLTLDFKRTKRDKYYLLALKVNGGTNCKTIDQMSDHAMVILGGGKLDRGQDGSKPSDP